MRKSVIILIILILCNVEFLHARNNNSIDSVSHVANRLMSYDVYINSYVISDAESDWIENEHPDWILKYFPIILKQYDCTLYSKFSLATSLYMKGKFIYLIHLWKKYGYLFEIEGERSNEEPIKEIWTLLDWYKIDPKKFKNN